MFVHSASIPIPFALAVWRVTHNQAGSEDWELLDKHPRDQALTWIRSILQSNGEGDRIVEELEWWSRELTRADN